MSELYPLRLSPSWRQKIWGSADLSPFFGPGAHLAPETAATPEQAGRAIGAAPGGLPVGEVWYTFEENTIANGALAGRTLGDLMASEGANLMGTAFRLSRLQRRSAGEGASQRLPRSAAPASPYFPILIKFLFTSDRLSVQVHPDDTYAIEQENSSGKTEMWYVLRAEPGAAIALGLRKSFSPDELRRAALTGEIAEHLNWVPVRAGDCIFCPAGTLHSIGPGLALCEIQQNSDLTYRLYDFGRLGGDGRPRELHIDRAVEVARLAPHPGPHRPEPFSLKGFQAEALVVCEYFRVERLACCSDLDYEPEPSRMHLLVIVKGRGKLDREPYEPGNVFLIPSALPPFRWRPQEPTVALRAYLP